MVATHQRKPWLWGPLSLLGLSLTIITTVLDQVHKWWMLGVFDIQNKGRVAVLPFLDLEFVKNTGVSYGLSCRIRPGAMDPREFHGLPLRHGRLVAHGVTNGWSQPAWA
jgi:hypothetical protein